MASKVTPSNLGVQFDQFSWILTCGWILNSFVPGVKSVTVDFSGETMRSLSSRKFTSLFMYTFIRFTRV